MRSPNAPFLELGFYFNRLSGREAFRNVVSTLITKRGAIPREASVYHSDSSNWIYADERRAATSCRLMSVDELWNVIDDDQRFIVKLSVEKGTSIVPDAMEYIVVLPINTPGHVENGNPIAVWVEGSAFSMPFPELEVPAATRRAGLNARAAFINLIQCLDPTYAAITVDYGLESPRDLRANPQTYAFRDFYLQYAHFGRDLFDELQQRFPYAEYEDIECGQFVSTTRPFVSKSSGRALSSSDAYSLSQYIGRVIAGKL